MHYKNWNTLYRHIPDPNNTVAVYLGRLVKTDQNQRNIQRMTLDEGDNAMLRPLLAKVLKARQKVLSPEHQLLIAGVSILMKKEPIMLKIRP